MRGPRERHCPHGMPGCPARCILRSEATSCCGNDHIGDLPFLTVISARVWLENGGQEELGWPTEYSQMGSECWPDMDQYSQDAPRGCSVNGLRCPRCPQCPKCPKCHESPGAAALLLTNITGRGWTIRRNGELSLLAPPAFGLWLCIR